MENDGPPIRRSAKFRSPTAEYAMTGLLSALQVGALSGCAGLLFGGIAGTVKSDTPRLFALASSLQWAALGSTFWLSKQGIAHAWEVEPTSPPQDRVKVSTAAGAVTGGFCGAVLRGPRNVIPGTIMFALFGYLGQSLYNILDARQMEQSQQTATGEKDKISLWRRMANSEYSPMQVLSDEEYEKILTEKLLRVDAEIAVIDDDIEKLRTAPVETEPRRDKNHD